VNSQPGAAGRSSDFKSAVLSATNLVDLIGRTVSLKKRGKNYIGLCPFHSEKTPSFNVDPTRQYFRCFGCGAKGNAIDFVIQRDRVEFIDALKQLGQAAGLEMPQFGQTKEKQSQRTALLDANSAAGVFFEKLLANPQSGAAARDYLDSRGFSADSIRKFQIGVALDSWDALLKEVGRKFAPPLLHAAGLVKARENGNGFYDTFRNRLMFPIRDEQGRVIAFGGRVMPGSQDPAKYLNSPETPVFSKSRCVYGLDLARQKIVESRIVAVVEGYTDVVMAHQFGATNVVSILGTAMTPQHVAILRRYADKIVLLFDPDAAGDNAMNRAVELFLTQPIEIMIAQLPEDLDPDEYLLKYGVETFDAVLSNASDALTYKWKQLVRQFNQSGDDLTGQQKAVEQYLELLASARGSGPVDSLRWGSALARVSRLTDIPVDELNRRFKAKPSAPKPRPMVPVVEQPVQDYAESPEPEMEQAPALVRKTGPDNARDRAERWILAILLAEPGRWYEVQNTMSVKDFTDPVRKNLADAYWLFQREEGEPVFNEFVGTLREPAAADLAVELIEEFDSMADPAAQLSQAIAYLAEVREREEQQKHLAELRRTNASPAELGDDVLRKLMEKARRPDLRRVGN